MRRLLLSPSVFAAQGRGCRKLSQLLKTAAWAPPRVNARVIVSLLGGISAPAQNRTPKAMHVIAHARARAAFPPALRP